MTRSESSLGRRGLHSREAKRILYAQSVTSARLSKICSICLGLLGIRHVVKFGNAREEICRAWNSRTRESMKSQITARRNQHHRLNRAPFACISSAFQSRSDRFTSHPHRGIVCSSQLCLIRYPDITPTSIYAFPLAKLVQPAHLRRWRRCPPRSRLPRMISHPCTIPLSTLAQRETLSRASLVAYRWTNVAQTCRRSPT